MSDFQYSFLADKYPARAMTLEDPLAGLADKESLNLAWILPPWARGSGGHTTIFRLIKMMEERGHNNTIFVLDLTGSVTEKTGERMRWEINEWFVPLKAPVFNGLDAWLGADVGIATFWTTAFALRDLPGCYEKCYLVQDFEPAFYPYSAEYIWAEETYRFGMRGIAYTPWMADILERGYGMTSDWFECGTDLDTYTMHAGPRKPATIAVYARAATGRRAVDLSLLSLEILKRRRPEVEVVLFGQDVQGPLPIEAENLGIARPARLAELYREATVGMVFSLTTHSLVAQEMMASGLPVVELSGANVSGALGQSGEAVIQAPADPAAIADAVEQLLDDAEERAALAARARAYVEACTWDTAGDRVDAALRRFLGTPRAEGELVAAPPTTSVAGHFVAPQTSPAS